MNIINKGKETVVLESEEKKSKDSDSSKRSLFIPLIIVINLIIMGFIATLYTKEGKKDTLVEERPIKVSIEKEQSAPQPDWLTYPTEGNFSGWEIKHPNSIIPRANEQNTQILIMKDVNEAVLINLDMNVKPEEIPLKQHISTKIELEHCQITSPLANYSLGNYQAFKYSGECGVNTVGDSIMFKNKTTYSIQSPHKSGEFFQADIYSDPEFADESDLRLAESIINTITILNPYEGQNTEENENLETKKEDTLNPNLKKYENKQIGYSIIYPNNYQVVDDNSWKNSDLVLYKGGQVYDLVIQVWNTKQEYEEYFEDNPAAYENMVVYKINEKFLTLVNMGEDSEVAEIVKSLKMLSQ